MLRRVPKIALFLLVTVGVVGACAISVGGAAGSPGPPPPQRDHGKGHWYEHACADPSGKNAQCQAQVVTNADGQPLAGGSPPASALGPAQFHGAYNLPLGTPVAGQQTIAIVDAYDDPNAESDLAAFSTQYGLPQCTTANGCFKKVNQTGGSTPPKGDTGWALEIALDVETAHGICQNCKILLVEATSNSYANLETAENTAAALGANVISNSWGGGESSTDDAAFNHPGVAITVSSGDDGYGVEYPAASKYVTAVGGTSLHVSGNAWSSETAWSGAGSGCSAYIAKPAWQTDSGCAKRTVADVSADADPNTGAAVYLTYGGTGWYQVGGTSLAAPLIASVYALANNGSVTYGSTPYNNTSGLRDITSGSNGSCAGSYLCTAKVGFDGPTGLGTPNGLASFTAGPPAPNFSLSASPASRTVVQGSGTSYGVTFSALNGYAGSDTLSVSGLPSGAVGTFSPTSVSSGSPASTLSVTTSGSTPTGTYNLTINGTDGTLTRSTTATLVVQAPPPSLTASPTTVNPGANVTAAWSNVSAPSTTDWIAVAVSGAANTSYVSWAYDSSCTTTAGTAKASGSCSIKMPTTAGSYQLRLFSNNGYTLLATANVTVASAPKANPTISTVASAGVTSGGTVKDTATLAGGGSPTGTITFKLFGPSDGSCTGSPVTTSTATVSGNGSYSSANYTAITVGTYHWIASYGGDSGNNTASGACSDSGEAVTVSTASPALSTSASAGITLGGTVKDTATLAGGGSPTGTITFRLYGPSDTSCTGTPATTSTASVSGNGSYSSASYTPTATGTYRWIASYAGDGNNNGATGACNDSGESVTVSAAPSISLTVSPGSAKKGSTVTVSWSGVSAPTTTDWIAIYTPGAANTAYLSWIYDSSCTTSAGGTAKASGSCSFKLPNTAGTYQFRLLSANGYTVLATSPNVTATS